MLNPRIITIIQARLTSTRFPRKVLEKVNGKSLIARVCAAARESKYSSRTVVVWAHKFPHLDENDVLGRFREIAIKYNYPTIVRITSDCPLIRGICIDSALHAYMRGDSNYVRHGPDGYDVQVFPSRMLWTNRADKEHVIKEQPIPKYMSVDTPEDLERVRAYAR